MVHTDIPPELCRWLTEASRGLAPEEKRRIEEEILDHVLEAAAEHEAAGMESSEALETAVVSLGDAGRTGRALRRADLRPWEAKILGGLARPQPAWILALYLAALPVFAALNLAYLADGRGRLLFALSLAAMAVGIACRFWLARRLALGGRLRAALVADLPGSWLFYAGLVVGTNLIHGHRELMAPVLYLLILAAVIAVVTHLWPKAGGRRPT